MAVRRLAEVQPDHFDFTPDNQAWVDRQIAKYPPGRQASAVMPLLRRAQAQHDGWLPKPAIEKVADILGMTYIRVLEIATFYSMYNLAPVGRHFIQFCGTTPCVLRGADGIRSVLEQRIGAQGEVSADRSFSWLEVECLGACCNAPMAQINDDYYEDLTPENFSKLLDDLAAGRPVQKGSQIGRRTSEPVGGLTSLTSLYGPDGSEDKLPGQDAPSAPDHAQAAAEHSQQDKQPEDLGHGGLDGRTEHSAGRPERVGEAADTRTEDPPGLQQTESSKIERPSVGVPHVAEGAPSGSDAPKAARTRTRAKAPTKPAPEAPKTGED